MHPSNPRAPGRATSALHAGALAGPHAASLRLGVNIDHVATVRQARGVDYPDPLEAALLAEAGGAAGITVHLREDRRHIQPGDVERLLARCATKVNLEMAATDAMVDYACSLRPVPGDACLVPEKREELTTEGGLAVAGREETLAPAVARLHEAGLVVSLFIEPDEREIEAAVAVGARVVELHTGCYANAASPEDVARELEALRRGAAFAHSLGLQVNGGHGLTLANVGPVAAIPEMVELNIGHSIVGRALMVGMREAVREMLEACLAARAASGAGGATRPRSPVAGTRP